MNYTSVNKPTRPNTLTPLEIVTLCQVHAYPTKLLNARGVDWLLEKGLIEAAVIGGTLAGEDWKLTARGRVMLQALETVPLPQRHMEWVVESSETRLPADEA